ncbi:MAG: hypothetical protein LBL66_10510 [Clostridiales bacterium]|jgi:hypothetical protein|nr:hypothetical protein [Clostridiales bacterium]
MGREINFTINGTVIARKPSRYSLTFEDVTESNRTADGTTYVSRLSTKAVIEIAWSMLSDEDMNSILAAVNRRNAETEVNKIIYFDFTKSGTESEYASGNFFVDGRSASVSHIDGDTIYWAELALRFREQ